MPSDELKRRISAGRGDALADLVLRNARIVNVFTDEIDTADIAISGNRIVGVGTYHGRTEVDLPGTPVLRHRAALIHNTVPEPASPF